MAGEAQDKKKTGGKRINLAPRPKNRAPTAQQFYGRYARFIRAAAGQLDRARSTGEIVVKWQLHPHIGVDKVALGGLGSGGSEAKEREKVWRGRIGEKGVGWEEKGRCLEGKSAGLCSDGTQSMWQGEESVEMDLARMRKSLARRGWCAPEHRVDAEKRVEEESERRQKEGKRDLAKAKDRTKAKSSAICCDDWYEGGRGQRR
jgi:hypothetical protein